MITWILFGISVPLVLSGWLWRRRILAVIGGGPAIKKIKRKKTLSTAAILLGAYLFITQLITLISGPAEREALAFSMASPRTELFGFSVSTTVIISWYIMGGLILLAIILRLTVLRHMKDVPRGIQNVLELAVESILKYTNSQAHGTGEFLGSYLFSIALFMVACAAVELFRLRAPTSDIMMTFAMAFLTFILINVYGIKKKGVRGRIKSLASPPVILPIRILTDIAVPVSLASRLFGNMLGGMIVMDLLYSALGHGAVGIPSLLGLYFNVFHPLIQAFIFITLTLTFINEAIE